MANNENNSGAMKGFFKKIGLQFDEVEENDAEYNDNNEKNRKNEIDVKESPRKPIVVNEEVKNKPVESNKDKIEISEKSRQLFKEETKSKFKMEGAKKKMDNNFGINNDKKTTIISADTEIIGTVKTQGNIELNGTLNGDLEAGGYVVIKGNMIGNIAAESANLQTAVMHGDINVSGDIHIIEGATLEGSITAGTVRLDGKINGDITAEDEVMINSNSMINGDIRAMKIGIESGAVIRGRMETITEESKKNENMFRREPMEEPAKVAPKVEPKLDNFKADMFKETKVSEPVKAEPVKVEPVKVIQANEEPKNDFKSTLEKRMMEKAQGEKSSETEYKAPVKPNVNASVDQIVNKFTTFKK